MTKKKADIGGKRLIGLAPNQWVNWLMNNDNLIVTEIVNSDFQWIARENDVLIKVKSEDEGEFLILNELQLRYNNKVPVRLYAYTALAKEYYQLPVYPILLNILPNSQNPKILDFYESEFRGLKSYQNYQVINLWEVDVNLVFENDLSTLLPFVPILKGGADENVVRQAVIELRKNETLQELEPLLSFFASFVLDIPIVQQIMRWDMTILRESPWYQEILKEGLAQGQDLGLQQGLQRGLQQGLQQGISEGELLLVNRLLLRKFGELSPNLLSQVQKLPRSLLENLGEDLLDFNSVSDLIEWLKRNSN